VNQIALTIADLVAEVHDAHHPIASSLYYEDQKEEAAKKSKVLRQERIPKYLKHFENVLKNNSQGQQQCLVGANITYVDLSMFHVLLGLEYAYPNAMKKINKDIPLLLALKQRVAERPNIKSYLESSRRIPFSTQGIFRHYPEVDPVE
jgi:glutathione S-transferase